MLFSLKSYHYAIKFAYKNMNHSMSYLVSKLNKHITAVELMESGQKIYTLLCDDRNE